MNDRREAEADVNRTLTVFVWVATVVAALGIAAAGVQKFLPTGMWPGLFAEWGFPPWAVPAVGAIEIAGSLLLVVPRTARYAAPVLGFVMMGAVITLVTHPGGRLGSGVTPAVYFVLLVLIAIIRWRASKRPLVLTEEAAK